MARKFLTPIDLNKLELQNVAIQNLATDPESPATGQVYYNTSLGKLKVYNGSSWVEVGNSQEQIEDYVNGLIAAGDAISIVYDDGAGTLTIANTGVHSLTGTANEITVSAASGAVTLSLPDTINADISGTAASATYAVTAGTANAVAANSVALGTDTTGNYVASISGTSNEIEVSGSGEGASVTIGLPDNVSVTGDLTVGGNLTISGSATYINTEIIELDDNTIVLNANATTASENAGIEVERGTVESNVSILWNESSNTWTITNDGTNYHNITRKFSWSVGNNSATSFAIDHNLGTSDVLVQVYDVATEETVEVDVVRTSSNRVTVSFASAPSDNAYRVVIVG